MKKNFTSTTTWKMTSTRDHTKMETHLKIDGNANVRRDTLDRHASDLFAKTIPAILAELALNFLEVDICAYVRLESMDTTVNTVSLKYFFVN